MSGRKKNKGKDPHSKREAKKYQNPIASREFILDFLADYGRPISSDNLSKQLHINNDDEQEGLRRRLIAMLRDGQLMKNRRGHFAVVDKMELVAGTIHAHKDGFGFLLPDKEGNDLFLSARQMRLVLHGDRVLARASVEDSKGRQEGVIVEVLERNTQETVGRFCEDNGMCFVMPTSKSMPQDIMVPKDKRHGAKDGQMVQIKLIAQPDVRRQALGEVVKILGEHMDPGMEIDVALLAYNIPHQWPKALLTEASQFTEEVSDADIKGRKDLREFPLITIDGEDAKDFDDAVYCEPNPKGGWRLVVAIADVSHYVKAGSALDNEAEERGNSVYFPGRVIPMLPEVLSNGLCSLNPSVDRLCMVCDMVISADGEIERYRFYDAVMHSKARMTYTKVQAISDGDAELRQAYQPVVEHIENLYQLYSVLRKKREIRGALDFDSTDTCILFDDHKKIEKIMPVYRNKAHMLIEECMLAANVCAARFLQVQKMPGLYRVHDLPTAERLEELRQSLALNGLSLTGGPQPEPIDYQRLLTQIQQKENAQALQTMVLRSLSQAVYSPKNLGHFGLAYKQYAHFTSPIRRYPDLLLHRALRHSFQKGNVNKFKYGDEKMAQIGEQVSITERRADEATRDVTNWLKCEYMSHNVGNTYTGRVTGVTAFGLFVILDDVYVEGLIHVTSLNDDYYHFDAVKHMLIGERTRTRYCLGQALSVQVMRVDLDQRQIDFDLTEKKDKNK